MVREPTTGTSLPVVRWLLAPRVGEVEQGLLGVDSLLLAQLLWNRGLRSSPEAQAFLSPGSLSTLGDPFMMLGMESAVTTLVTAIREGNPIAVYGDYDVDGVAGAALLAEALRFLGGTALLHVPHRVRDGYGLNSEALQSLARRGAKVVVTVDCGITANQEVELAAELGLRVIVTDHHTVPSRLPTAVAVLNPHQDECGYPFKELAGGGVAFQLARALLERMLPSGQVEARILELADLAALSTVADVVPLVGENRTLVALGLKAMRLGKRPGLHALCEVAARTPSALTVRDLSFALIPRLNAAGRMGEAQDAIDLLLVRDPDQAQILAAQLDGTNDARRQLMEQLSGGVLEQAAEIAGAPAIVIEGDFPIGLAGLLAARLVDRWLVPSVVIQRGESVSRGSARAPQGFDLMQLLDATRPSLVQYGGHPRAAGFTLATQDISGFRDAFSAAASTLPLSAKPERLVTADAALRLRSIGPLLADLLERFEPSGEGNPSPTFVSRGTLVSRKAGSDGPVRLRISDGDSVRRAVLFRPRAVPPLGTRVELYYEVRRSLWRGDQQIDMVVHEDGLVPLAEAV
ncbi:MAG: single-stranded-DNA-specific exonuclease RecJ [Chloroflexi bacterium]|nr:single-stranded-DNA-specific exonuclease RecJ [Chloroflexota bacterium]